MAKTGKVVLKTRQVVVVDDAIPATLKADLFRYAARLDYRSVHAAKWTKVWRLSDGTPLTGPAVKFSPTEPAASPIQTFLAIVHDYAQSSYSVIKPPPKWHTMTGAPWLYPSGAALSLHVDGAPAFAGSYVYFLHNRWNIHWGGQLIILDENTPSTFLSTDHSQNHGLRWLMDEFENDEIWNPGIATCVFPKPNRLVFLSEEAQHFITRVDKSAGQNHRYTIAGFFLAPAQENASG